MFISCAHRLRQFFSCPANEHVYDPTPLYQRWREVAALTPHQTALRDLAAGRRWTFQEMAAEAESASNPDESLSFPRGVSAEFVIAVLRAWRWGQVVCPLEPDQPPPRLAAAPPGGIVHLKTTSATTGLPRLVAFTSPQLMADAENIVLTMGLRSAWPNLGVISLAHSYGFSNLVLPLLLHGIPLILGGAALPEAIRRAAEMEPALALAAVPALWRTWYDADAIPAHVRLAISAGAPLPLELEKAVFERHGIKIHNFYGSSECGGIAYDASAEPRLDSACVGRPMRNVHVSIGKDGCVVVRGGAVAQSYWPVSEARLKAGVFHTSDLGELSGGAVYLRGRATDQINVAGRKVLPETIEMVLRAHPHVRACLAFGVPSPDGQRGETIVACVAGDTKVSGEALRQFAMSKLPAWQVPREWWFVKTLEMSHRGKVSRAQWRKKYLERGAPAGRPDTTRLR